MEAIQAHVLRIIISNTHQSKNMEEVIQVSTSLFEYLKKKNNDIILDINDLREKTNYFIYDLEDDISYLEKKLTV